jgi:hypothetical protein
LATPISRGPVPSRDQVPPSLPPTPSHRPSPTHSAPSIRPKTDPALLPTTRSACPSHTLQHHPRTRSRTPDQRSTRRPGTADRVRLITRGFFRTSIVLTGLRFLRPRGKRSERPETRECDGGRRVVVPLSHMRIVAVIVPSDPRTAKPGTLTQSTTTREPDSVHHLAPGGGGSQRPRAERERFGRRTDAPYRPLYRARNTPHYIFSLFFANRPSC